MPARRLWLQTVKKMAAAPLLEGTAAYAVAVT
jgi:hypothetical protein